MSNLGRVGVLQDGMGGGAMSQLFELKVENTFGPSGPVVSISGQTLWCQPIREHPTLSIKEGIQASIV